MRVTDMFQKKRGGILLSLFLTTAVLGITTLILAVKDFDTVSNHFFIATKILFAVFLAVATYFQFTSRKIRKKKNN